MTKTEANLREWIATHARWKNRHSRAKFLRRHYSNFRSETMFARVECGLRKQLAAMTGKPA